MTSPSTLRHKFLQFGFACTGKLRCYRWDRVLAPDKSLILTGYTPDIASYGEVASANLQRYASLHGYHFRAKTEDFDPNRPPAWSKIRFIQEALTTHRYVLWIDADALVMNSRVTIESLIEPEIDIHLARALTPFPHINTGVMLFCSTIFTRLFLNATWRMVNFINDPTWEQRATNHLVQNYRLPRIKIHPNRRFNSYGHVTGDPDPYQPGDFVIHFPGRPDKLALMTEYAARAKIG